MTKKPKKNRRTLKKKIRRIISIVILFIFILLAIVQTWIAYQLILFGTSMTASIVGQICSVLVDGDKLKMINSPDDFRSAEYREIVKNLREAFPDLWDDSPLQFSVLREFNGRWFTVIDSKEELFQIHKISEENSKKIRRLRSKEDFQEILDPFRIVGYTPIHDNQGNIVGLFGAQFSPFFLRMAFIGIGGLIVLLTIAGYIFSLIVTRIMTMRITQPLEQLDKKIRMIARAEGDLSQRITFTKTYREVEDLAEATNMVMESTDQFVTLLQDKQYRVEEKNRQLANQAEELEAQKEELSAQTEELLDLNENLELAMRELQDAQVQLVQSEKMASLGQLTAGVAHEINTPLGAINSNINIIQMVMEFLSADIDLDHNDKAKTLLGRLEKANDTNKLACERIMQIVRHLKNFARLDESDFQEACLLEGMDSVLILSHNILKHRVQVHKEYGQIPLVKCFPNQLNQVFMNLIVNASQAITETGDIWIRSWAKDEKVYFQIEDNGVGISQKNLRKIFDPGFTTKGVGVGTGLGLSICYKIIENHNGTISVESRQGKGTIFTLELPINNTFDQVNEEAV